MERFNPTPPLSCDQLAAEVTPADDTIIEIRDEFHGTKVFVTVTEARALRAWLEQVLPAVLS